LDLLKPTAPLLTEPASSGILTERLIQYRPEIDKNANVRLSPESIANVR
jgi:hypothetical protein